MQRPTVFGKHWNKFKVGGLMQLQFKPLALILCAGLISACSSEKENSRNSGTIDTSKILQNRALTAQEKGTELARAAEQLVQTSSFSLAESVLDTALAVDPDNKLAQFYKAFLADKLALRGIAVRIKPLVAKNEKAAK